MEYDDIEDTGPTSGPYNWDSEVRRACSGSDELSELGRAILPGILQNLFPYAMVKHRAADLVQTGLIAIWQASEEFNGEGRLEGYAAERARWAILDSHKAEARHEARHEPLEPTFTSVIEGDEIAPEDYDQSTADAMVAWVAEDPHHDEEVFIMQLREQMPAADRPIYDLMLEEVPRRQIMAQTGIRSRRQIDEAIARIQAFVKARM